MKKFFLKMLGLTTFVFLALSLMQCASRATTPLNLRTDFFGVRIGMNRDEAKQHLSQVGTFERNERKRQEIWALPNDALYSRVAIGYDSENKVRYVTAFARQQGTVSQIHYEDFGDLKAARQNVFMSNIEYVWEVPSQENKPGFFTIVRGIEPSSALSFSLMKSASEKKESEEEDED